MAIFSALGNNLYNTAFLGDEKIIAAYLGDNQVWRGFFPTDPLTQTFIYNDIAVDYSQDSNNDFNTNPFSFRCNGQFRPSDQGIIAEAGAGLFGWALYMDNGTLYWAAGDGSVLSASTDFIELSYDLPQSGSVIEVSFDNFGKGFLYFDGQLVDSKDVTIFNVSAAGLDNRGIGRTHSSVRLIRNSSNFTGVIDECIIFQNGVTEDILGPNNRNGVTSSFTENIVWSRIGTEYSDRIRKQVSIRCNGIITSGDTGILVEKGGTGDGLVIYQTGGVIYAQSGAGNGFGFLSGRRLEVSATVTNPIELIEVSINHDIGSIALYFDGVLVDSLLNTGAVTDNIDGSDGGGIGRGYRSVAVNRGGFNSSSPDYTGTVFNAYIFINELTSDVI